MKSNELEILIAEEVMLFKSGYEYVPFMCDVGSKNDKIFSFLFNKLPMTKSTVGERNINIDKKKIYKIHVDDVDQILTALQYILEKHSDPEVKDWIDDINYHLKHFKRIDPL